MKCFKQKKVEGVTVTLRESGDGSGLLQVRARSKRHADRLAARLNWYSYENGIGRPYANVTYSCGYLWRRYGWDN